MTIKKTHYELIRPTEEETISNNVLDLYDSLCDFLTLPWLLVELGHKLGEYYNSDREDEIYREYIDRCIFDVSNEIGQRCNWRLNID